MHDTSIIISHAKSTGLTGSSFIEVDFVAGLDVIRLNCHKSVTFVSILLVEKPARFFIREMKFESKEKSLKTPAHVETRE